MAWNLTNTDEVWMKLDNGFYSVDIPKFRYQVVLDGDFATIYWTDSESSGEAGIRRQTPAIDYHDFEVGGVAVSSAAEIETGLLNYRNSAFGGGGVQSVTGLNTDNTDPLNPIVQISVDGATITGDGTPGNPLVATPASSVAWGGITGTLSDQTDLQTALDAKQATLVSGTNIKTVNGTTLLGSGDLGAGYTLNVFCQLSSQPQNTNRYFGNVIRALIATSGANKIYFPRTGTIKWANIYSFATGVTGTNEGWSCYIRVNNTTDHLVATVSSATDERIWANSGLSISVNQNDYFEIKLVAPVTWATAPTQVVFGGNLYVE